MKKLILFLFLVTTTFAQTNHGSLKLDCSFCHSCENPTKLNPCLKNCPRDEMITVYHSPEKAPDIIKIDVVKSEKDIYQKVIFTHRLHAEMSNMAGGCEICHHYNPPGKVVACRECHENNRIREELNKPDLKGAYHRQCLTCHKTWTAQDDCNFCHLPNGVKSKEKTTTVGKFKAHKKIETPVKIVFDTKKHKGTSVQFYHNDHSEVFDIECTKCHSAEACAKCHNQNLSKAKLSSGKNDKHKVCSACHDVKKNCNLCHSTKDSERFNHLQRTGFELKEYHSNLSCSKCHKSSTDFRGIKKECSSCHSGWNSNFNHKKAGLILDETHESLECQDCHESKNMKIDCSNCHEDNFYPKNLPGKKIRK